MSAELREKLATFAFVARLPDLTPFDRATYRAQIDLPSQITALVTRKADLIPPLVERSAGRWIFSERVVAALVAKGFEPRENSGALVSVLQKGPAQYRVIRESEAITEVVYHNSGDGLHICLLPYADGIAVGAVVFKNRERVCIEGRRVVEKLRSFEY